MNFGKANNILGGQNIRNPIYGDSKHKYQKPSFDTFSHKQRLSVPPFSR